MQLFLLRSLESGQPKALSLLEPGLWTFPRNRPEALFYPCLSGRDAGRRRRFITSQNSAARHKVCSEVRRMDALATVMLTPLNSATYAPTQMGHLGSKTKVALGMSHPAASPPRRMRDAGRRAL